MEFRESKLVEAYFYMIVFLKIIDLTTLIPVDNYINTFMVMLGAVLLGYTIIREGLKIKYIYPKELKLYIIATIVTLLLNYDTMTIKSTIFQIFYVVILFLLSQHFFNDRIYKNIKRIILVTTFLLVSMFYIRYIIYRRNVLFNNINGGALLVALNIFLLILMKPKTKGIYLLNRLLIVYYIIFMGMSYARTSIFALIIVCFIYSIRKLFEIKYMKSILIILMLAILVLGTNSIFSKPNIEREIESIEKTVNTLLSSRYYLWKYGISNLKGHIFFGIGADLEGKIIEKIPNYILSTQSALQKDILSRTNLHNGYIQILVQNGMIGVILMIWYLYQAIKRMEPQNEKKYIVMLFVFMNLCENALLLSNSLIVILLWLLLGFSSNDFIKPIQENQEAIGEKVNE